MAKLHTSDEEMKGHKSVFLFNAFKIMETGLLMWQNFNFEEVILRLSYIYLNLKAYNYDY